MIQKLESLLYLHTLDTVDLIHGYYLERLQEQKETQDANEGVLTVKLIFINDVLKVEILNAHCIRSKDSNGTGICLFRFQFLLDQNFFLRYYIFLRFQ